MISLEQLAHSPLLVALSDEQIKRFIDAGRVDEFREGEIIVQEGSIGDALYLILAGDVIINIAQAARLTVLSGDDTLGAQYEGDFFGEMSFLDHEPRAASVIAGKHTRVFRISKEDIHKLFASDVDFHVVLLTNMSRVLSRRLRSTNKVIGESRKN